MARKLGLAHRLYVGDLAYNFIGRRKLWYGISAALIGLALLGLLVRGLQLGIDFKGGADFQAPTQVNAQTVPEYRDAVAGTNLPNMDDTTVTTVGDSVVRVQTRTLDVPEVTAVRQALAKQSGVGEDKVTYNLIGASWGKQITQQAVLGLVVFLGLVALLIWAYFRELKMSIAALLALAHDLVVTIGIYALTGFTVTPSTVIGILTILGYSLYDTVVVFDKVRENTRSVMSSNETYADAANRAVNQVLVRSINTTVIGVLPVAALLFAGTFILGSGPLKDLGLALFIGMIVGAYSSIFIATPLLVQMKEREPAHRRHRKSLESGSGDSQPRSATNATRTVAATAAPTVGIVAADRVRSAEPVRHQPSSATRAQRKK